MKSSNEVISILKNEYSFLMSEFGVKKIGVFGSIVKGTQTVESDIDLVVELDQPLGLKFFELRKYLEKLFGKNVDVLTKDGIENIRVKSVAEGIKRNIIYV